MNVNPVSPPGTASSSQLAARAESKQASTTASDRGQAVQRQGALANASVLDRTTATVERGGQSEIADRQKAEQLKAFIGDNNVRLSTYHDESSGRSILEVRDQTTGDVVSQYPSEELIRLYAALRAPLVDQSA